MTVDRQRLVNIASVTMFIHVLCGLMRYLTNVNVVLAVDYLSTAVLLCAAVTHCVQYRADPRALLRGCREQTVLCLFLLWCVMSQIVDVIWSGPQSAYFLPNALHDTLLIVFVFFPYGRFAAQCGAPRIGAVLLKVLIALWTAFIAFMLVNVFMGRVVHLPGGIRLGVYDGLKFNLNNNQNHTSCFEFIFMILCVFELLISRRRSVKALYAPFALVHFVGMALSDSRTFFYSSLILCAAFVFYILTRVFKEKPLWQRLLLSAVIALAAAMCLYALRLSVWKIYDALKDDAPVQKSLIYEKLTTFTSRTTIWKGCIQNLYSDVKLHFFGMGVANSKSLVFDVIGSKLYTHNQFLEVFVCVGIPGLILFVMFVLLALSNAVKVLFDRCTKPVYAYIALCIPILLLANQFEALLLFYRRPGSYVFYLCCGFLCEYAKRLKKTQEQLS